MKFLQKAKNIGLHPAAILSWLSLRLMTLAGAGFGSFRLRIKAFLLGVELGPGVKAHGPVGLLRWPGGHISIGANVSIISSWRRATAAALNHPTRLRVFGSGVITIGRGCELSGASITARSTSVTLGKHVMLGPNCVIVDSDFHAPWPAETRHMDPGMERDAPVIIGDHVWLGMNCIVLKGVTIGEGAIIGAGSVVCRDVPPRCVACGTPARIVKGPEHG